jgi:hypothetical protein
MSELENVINATMEPLVDKLFNSSEVATILKNVIKIVSSENDAEIAKLKAFIETQRQNLMDGRSVTECDLCKILCFASIFKGALNGCACFETNGMYKMCKACTPLVKKWVRRGDGAIACTECGEFVTRE